MAVALGKSPTELILVAQAANAILLPIMAFFVLYCANGKDLGKWRNHIFANCAGRGDHRHHAVHVLPQHVKLPHVASGAYRRVNRVALHLR